MPERDAVLFANEAFYRAFADSDFDTMAQLWASGEPVTCIHPGWPPLTGRDSVIESWRRILANGQAPKVACVQPEAFLLGDAAFVICYEAVDDNALVATNLFRREGRQWKLVHHQAGPAPALPPEEPAEPAPRPN